jgi:hypothetical protein
MFSAIWNDVRGSNNELFALLFIVGCATPNFASARDYYPTVPSGVSVLMHQYRSYNKDCQNNGGLVKLLGKPQHGTATPRTVDSHIGAAYFSSRSSARCRGMPIRAFEVDYRSRAGFHGTDIFTIEEQIPDGRSVVDTYTVNVK